MLRPLVKNRKKRKKGKRQRKFGWFYGNWRWIQLSGFWHVFRTKGDRGREITGRIKPVRIGFNYPIS